MRARWVLLPSVAVLSMLGCGASDPAAPGTDDPPVPAAGLDVRDPRISLVPGAMAALYLRIVNTGGDADRLTAVETQAADAAEIHESIADGDVLRMVAHPDGFEIPAGGTVELAPGGKHVMLVGFRSDADAVRLTLHFERAGTVTVEAPVESSGNLPEEHHRADHHG